MTEKAVRKEFDGYVKSVALQSLDELDPTKVVEVNLPVDKVKSVMRDEIRQEMARVKSSFQDQTDVIIDTAVKGQVEDGDLEEFLKTDLFYRNYAGDADRKAEFAERLGEYFERTVKGVAPLIESEEESFWDCVEDVYEKGEAVEVLTNYFSRSDIVKDYTDGMVLNMALDTGLPIEEVEYTEESVRVFTFGEEQMRDRIREQANLVYD